MSLYFDNLINSPYKNVITTHIVWHPQASCLAVAAFSEDKGGTLAVYTGEGKLNDEVEIPPHPTAQVTAVAWHPIKRILAVGWESGELFLWNDHEGELHEIQRLHRAPISILIFSSGGKRLVTGDTSGFLLGWNADSSGNLQTVFSHELKDSLAQIVFRVYVQDEKNQLDISGLARAAVNGDEAALDIFSYWRPKTGHKRVTMVTDVKDNANFFVGSSTGVLYHINEAGNCVEVLQAEGGIKRLLHHNSRNLLVVITENLVLGQFNVASDGAVSETAKAKLSGRSAEIQVCWAGAGILAVSTGDTFVRLWNVDSGENYVLDLGEGFGYGNHENILCLSYSVGKKVLSAGTNIGNVAMWKYEEPSKENDHSREMENHWKLQSPTVLSGAITQICWGSSLNLLAANSVRNVYILNEQDMSTSCKDQICVVQMAPMQLMVSLFSTKTDFELKSEIQVRGVHNSLEYLIVWNANKMVVYELNADASRYRLFDSFLCETDGAVVHENSIYSMEKKGVNVRTLQGTVKTKLQFSEGEGDVTRIDVCGNFLVVATVNGIVKIWDLSRREPKVHSQGKQIGNLVKDFGEIISAKCNSNGTKVSISVANSSLLPDPKLFMWNLENDSVTFFNFATGLAEEDDGGRPPQTAPENGNVEVHQDRSIRENSRAISGRFVIFHSWDSLDPRILVCEGKPHPKYVNNKINFSKGSSNNKSPLLLVSLFVTSDYGIVVQEYYSMWPEYSKLLGVNVPFFYLMNSKENKKEIDSKVVSQKVMRDFVGLEESDKTTREAMLNFSLFLSIGNMDEAFKAIKAIKSQTVWENMAKMCVKTKRLDVAFLCLGNMGHARGARALKMVSSEEQLDTQVAILALQLGMVSEAELLLINCKRFDLLNKLYQGSGFWSKAIETAEKNDRIHLRSTHYNYARHLESKGDYSGAITHYEKSDTFRFEVPRMLFDDLPTLEDYIMHTDDTGLRRWWAQYLESTGEMETALQFYEAAGDHLSLVRVYCYCSNLEKAAEIANESGDRAACYHLARQYENIDQVKEAIHFFTRAQAYGNAIRICRDNNYDDQLLNLALLAGPQDQLEAARYFSNEDRPQINKAVMLYHKAGFVSKAVDLAFKSGHVSNVAQIASELDETADPIVIERCAEYFKSLRQYDKAVNLLVIGKKYIEALDICVENNVQVTEELAERFTLPKEEDERNNILEKVAECAYAQGNYKLATKKFTQSGSKVKAMKCLLKSGDTERIIYFANVCRQADIYVMAANYLQSLDWRKYPRIMENIVQFYTRAKKFGLLAEFYDSCSQIEVDEYQNYEKSLAAIREALKYTMKADDHKSEQKKLQIQFKIEKMQDFIEAKNELESSAEDATQKLYSLLRVDQVEIAVRRGDIFATIVHHYAGNRNFNSALSTLQEMRNTLPDANPVYFVDRQVLENIASATGVSLGISNNDAKDSDQENSEEEIEERSDLEDRPGVNQRVMNGKARLL